jgi:hypothetical protein
MKKSRMLLLFGGLFLMLVAYVAWCGRTFYLRPQMPGLMRVPVEARELARAGIEESGLLRPERLSIERFKRLLAHPYESQPSRICIWPVAKDQVLIVRSDGNGGLILVERRDGWAFLGGGGPQECAAKLGK